MLMPPGAGDFNRLTAGLPCCQARLVEADHSRFVYHVPGLAFKFCGLHLAFCSAPSALVSGGQVWQGRWWGAVRELHFWRIGLPEVGRNPK